MHMSSTVKHSIGVIIPTYNRAALLRECINSILATGVSFHEIIVVNDGSTDDTESVAISYGDRVTLITKENGGKAAALNVALAQCSADYIWICDDDDLAAPGGIAKLVAALDADQEAGFAYGTYKVFCHDAKVRMYSDPVYRARAEEPSVKLRFLEGMFTNQFAMLVRRSLYEKVGPFREDMLRSQDYEMALRLSRNARSISVPDVIFYYREHTAVRGPKLDSFSVDKIHEKWRSYERKVLLDVRRHYALEEFTPSFAAAWEPALAQRAALMERAYIGVRRAMWDEAIADFLAASEMSSAPLSPQETHLMSIMFDAVVVWSDFKTHPQWIAGLQECYRANACGRQMMRAACRPLLWYARRHFKKGRIRMALLVVCIWAGIMGVEGAASR